MLSTTKVKAVIFELDGTLVDTAAGVRVAAEEMLEDLNLPHLNAAHISDWIGDGFQKLIHRILSRQFDGKVPDDLFRMGSALFLKAYQKKADSHIKLYKGVEICLRELSKQKVLKAVLTNQTTSQANEMLTTLGIRHHFNLVLGKDALQEPKPSPAGIFETALLLRLNPDQLLMVGGSVNDISAARAAGSPVVCVSYGYNYGIDIRKTASDMILDSLEQLPEMLSPRPVQMRKTEFILNPSIQG